MKLPKSAFVIAATFVLSVISALLVVPTAHCIALGAGLSTMGTCSGSLVAYLTLGVVFAFPASLVFGVPLYLACRKFGWLSWWHFGIGAGFAGVLSALCLHALDSTTYLLGSLELFGGLGTFAGLVFWCFGPWRTIPCPSSGRTR